MKRASEIHGLMHRFPIIDTTQDVVKALGDGAQMEASRRTKRDWIKSAFSPHSLVGLQSDCVL